VKLDKVVARIARIAEEPELLEQVARDVGAGLAEGERDSLERVARELAIHAPHRSRGAKTDPNDYWAGYAAAIGTLLAAQRAAAEKVEAREAALRHTRGETAQGALEILAARPSTGAEIAAQLGVTPGAASKVLAQLRGAGLARTLGGQPYPKRGARKPHVLTPLGSWAADELRRRRRAAGLSPLAIVADAG
jgi:CRP-like cAMP-binding protein